MLIVGRKPSRLYRNFSNCSETLHSVRKLSELEFSRLSGNFPDSPETFQTFQKLSKLFRNFPASPETFQTCSYGEKISRRQTAFRLAMSMFFRL